LSYTVKLRYPEEHFTFLGFERVENDSDFQTKILNSGEEAVLMLKNLNHYAPIA
jgi:hypothetical protein